MDMERVSACSYPLRERPWQEALEVIAAAGFERVDLLGRLPHLSQDPRTGEPEEIREFARARGLLIVNLGTYVGQDFVSDDYAAQEHELDHLKRAVDVAEIMGARSIRVRPGRDRVEDIDAIVPWFKRGADYGAEKGVFMGFENHGGGISGAPDRCVELAEKVGSRYFGVLYDPCNVYRYGGDYRQALEIMKEHIVHVHLKDGVRRGDEFEYTMLGEGEIDMRWIIDQLEAQGYDGDYALEYELESVSPEIGLPVWFQTARQL